MFRDQAEMLLEAGNDSELRKLAEERINISHSDAWAHYYLGMALYRQRDPFLAKQHFDKVVGGLIHYLSLPQRSVLRE